MKLTKTQNALKILILGHFGGNISVQGFCLGNILKRVWFEEDEKEENYNCDTNERDKDEDLDLQEDD